MLRSTLLAASRSPRVRAIVESGPFDPLVSRFVAGATAADALAVARVLTVDRLVTLDHLGEDTTERPQADANVAAYEHILALLGDDGPRRPGRGVGEALGARAEPRGRRRQDRPGRGASGVRGGRGRRDHGHGRHGGPHHHRPHAGHRARAAGRPPVGGRGGAGAPAADRGGLPRPRRAGIPGAAVQGRLRRARVGGLPRPGGRRRVRSRGACGCSWRGRGCRWWRPTIRA